MLCKTSMTVSAVNESNPVVGSSRKMREGSVINSTPMEHRFLSPPETPLTNGPPILVSAALFSFSSSRISSTTVLIWLPPFGNLSQAANVRHSQTVNVCIRISSC